MFFVATNGNDQWSGRAAEPNKAKTDGPVRTIDEVLGLTRAAPTNSQGQKLRTVYLRAGTYFLEQPVTIQAEDSNLNLTAFPGEKPVLSGGRLISGWRETTIAGKKLWVAELPKTANTNWSFHELWVNGVRASGHAIQIPVISKLLPYPINQQSGPRAKAALSIVKAI